MTYDFFAENPYKKDESKFNTQRYKDSSSIDKRILFKLFDKLDLL